MGLMGYREGGRSSSTKISHSRFTQYRAQAPSLAVYGDCATGPLLPSKYSWPITICARLACSYTISPQIRVAKLSPLRQSALKRHDTTNHTTHTTHTTQH